MKKNKKAFTLIELLAVIIILGVLMLVAIPSVTEYITNSRKKAYLATANQYINGTAVKVNAMDLPITDMDTTYYIPASCIKLEKGGKSPYGNWNQAYIVVTINGQKYDYYWTSLDESGYGIMLSYGNRLTGENIKTGVESLDLTIGVGARSKVSLLDNSCDVSNATVISASATIADGESLDAGTIAQATDVSCFAYDVLDESAFVDWYGASNLEEASEWLMDDYKVDASKILNNVMIYGYNKYQSDEITLCPSDVVIPNKIENKSVVWLYYRAFQEEPINVSNYGLSGEITKLANNLRPAYNRLESSITSVVLPNGLIIIGESAFSLNQIRSIVLPSSLEYIDSDAFYGNQITTLVIPSNVKTIDSYAFAENQITSLVIPSNVENVGSYAFQSNRIANLTIQNGVSRIERNAFTNNLLTTVTIPSSLQYISQGLFRSNQLTSVVIPEGILEIGTNAFENNLLSSVTLPLSLPYLCDFAFDSEVNLIPLNTNMGTMCCNCPN